MSQAVNYDGIELTKLYLFGTSASTIDFNERVRAPNGPSTTITYNADIFLTAGAGRFAYPSRVRTSVTGSPQSSDFTQSN